MSESPRLKNEDRERSRSRDIEDRPRYESPMNDRRGRSRSGDRRRSLARDETNHLATIYVAKLSRGTREADLKEGFSRFGPIKNIALKSSYAFITYESADSVAEAISRMNGAKFVNGEELVVEQSGT